MQAAANYPTTYTNNHASGGHSHYGHNIYNYSNGPGGSDTNQCLRDLRVTDPRQDQARIEGDKDNLLRDCYTWLLKDENFQRWRTQDELRLMWIRGDPGKGKTMMTMGVIAELSRTDEVKRPTWNVLARLWPVSKPCLLAFFFCQSARPELNNAVSVLRGIIYLLVDQRKELIRHMQRQYEIVGKQLFEGPNAVYSLRGILSNMLDDPSLPPTYLLVDALDECTSGLSELLHIITDESLGQRSRVKWLVTSRNTPEIERYLQLNSRGVNVSLEIKASHVSRAVAAFVQHKVQQLAIVQKYPPKLHAEVQQQLRDKAEGTFLWVWLVCKELEKVPVYCTREVLQAVPRGLDPLYERMMAQILGQDDARKVVGYCKAVLRAVTITFRPLRLRELVIVASLPSDKFDHPQAVIDLVIRCSSFLTVRQDTVSFIHLSAKDYFTAGNGRQAFDGTLADEHGQMANRLLGAMNGVLRRDICGLQKPGARTQDASTQGCIENSNLPQIAYACEYWVEHVQAGKQSCRAMCVDGGIVHNFFQKHLLHWLEALSLLQKMPEAILALQKLEAEFKGRENATMSKFVHDALRFAMWGRSGIHEAPLQVYYGMLAFAPEQSIVRQQFKGEMPEGARVKPRLKEEWGSLLQTLEGHTNVVRSVAFSVDGGRLASSSYDNTVRLWDAKTGHPLQTFEGHTHSINSVAFSRDGNQLASASDDKTVRLWDTKMGQPLYTFKEHTSYVYSVVFSADGDRLASASHDRTVRVWDAKTRQLLCTLDDHSLSANSVSFSGDGNRLVSACSDMAVRVWNIETGQLLYTLEGHTKAVISVAFSADGHQLASASHDQTVRVWDANTRQLLHTLRDHTQSVRSVAFSADSNRVASASYDKTVRIWDAKTGKLLHTLKGHAGAVNSVAFSADGHRLASASNDQTVRVWDTTARQSPQMLEGHTKLVHGMAFSADGHQLASASYDNMVRLWDTKTGQPLHIFKGHTSRVYSVVFSKAGDRMASASHDQTVRVWDIEARKPLRTLEDHTSYASSEALLEDDIHSLSVSLDKFLPRRLKKHKEPLLHTMIGHKGAVHSVVFSPDGERLASASYDTTVRVWNAKKEQLLHTLWAHTNCVISVAFSAAGDRLASGSDDMTVRVWDVNIGGHPLHTLRGHTNSVTSVAFSVDGDWLASGSDDKTVRLWSAKKGQLLHTFELLHSARSIVFSEDGSGVYTDEGLLPLPQPVLSTYTPSSQRSAKFVSVSDRWVKVDGEDMLWIPADYDPECTAVHGGHVALGYSSGQVLLLQIT